MGLITWGILGGFRKKTGAVVGAYHRGQDVIRAIPRRVNTNKSDAQLMQQSKFGLVTKYLSSFSGLIKTGYSNNGGKRTQMNEAVTYHLKNAVLGVWPDFEIDHSKLFFSQGKREIAHDAKVTVLPEMKLEFTWTHDGLDRDNMSGNDIVVFVAYDPISETCIHGTHLSIKRSAKKATLILPFFMEGNEVHCYLSVNSNTKPVISSKSMYLGKVTPIM